MGSKNIPASFWTKKTLHHHEQFLPQPSTFKNHNKKINGMWKFTGEIYLKNTRYDEPYRRMMNAKLLEKLQNGIEVKGERQKDGEQKEMKTLCEIDHEPAGRVCYLAYCCDIRMMCNRKPTTSEIKLVMTSIAAIPSAVDECEHLCALRVAMQTDLENLKLKEIINNHYQGKSHNWIIKPGSPVSQEKKMCISTSIDFQKDGLGNTVFPPTSIMQLDVCIRVRVFSSSADVRSGVIWCDGTYNSAVEITKSLVEEWKKCMLGCGEAVGKLAGYCTISKVTETDDQGCFKE